MELFNHTQLNAEIVSGSTAADEHTIMVQVVGKALGRFDARRGFEMLWEEEAPILRAPMSTPWGDMPSDVSLRKRGADVVALGRAYSPSTNGSAASVVQVVVGPDERRLLVFGDRYWERRHDRLVASPPDEFVALDVTWSRSFGGQSIDDEGNEVVFPFNAGGCGYQVSEDVAEGERLPNFEDPAAPIGHFADAPRPCNVAPVPGDVPLAMMGRIDELMAPILRGKQTVLPPELGNVAHPNFQFEQLAPGQWVCLTGMTPERPFELVLPKIRFLATASIGDRQHQADLALDTLLFLPETGFCTMTWRTRFAYRFVPHELRSVRLDAYPVS